MHNWDLQTKISTLKTEIIDLKTENYDNFQKKNESQVIRFGGTINDGNFQQINSALTG